MRTYLTAVELWNNQFSETKILGLPVSRRMRCLVYMASRDKVDMYTFQKSFNAVLEKLGKSKFGFERTADSNFKSKRHEGSGNELVDYSRAPCLGARGKRHVGSGNENSLLSRLALKTGTELVCACSGPIFTA